MDRGIQDRGEKRKSEEFWAEMAGLSPFPFFFILRIVWMEASRREEIKKVSELLDGSEDFRICKHILELFAGVYLLPAISLSLSLSPVLCPALSITPLLV